MKRTRPKLHKISEEMKAWSAALTEDVAGWPQVKLRPMFGFFGCVSREYDFCGTASNSHHGPSKLGCLQTADGEQASTSQGAE